jgi:glycosyltransferase involved in cell wall biosynthesis
MRETGRQLPAPLNIAMIGTRGVPAAYGGFETAVEEIGSRLAGRGHAVTVYCRNVDGASEHERGREYAGMRLVHLPAVRLKAAETLSHTALSVTHAATRIRRPDVAFVFNAANAPFVPLLRARGVPTAVHVDGLEWQRDKWRGAGSSYYRWAEGSAVRNADALIADAQGIADYYATEFGVPTRQIAYGAPVQWRPVSDRLDDLGLSWKGYHLVVARFEPENHVDVAVAGYVRSSARLPLVVVGAAPYAAGYTERVRSQAAGDPRVMLLGGVYDQDLLDQLYAGALSYVHGHSVGGTNPSLLRAMGAGTAVLAWDVSFNRGVAGEAGRYFRDEGTLTDLLETTELAPDGALDAGVALREVVERHYRWDQVAIDYESLAEDLVRGASFRAPGRRRVGETRPVRATTTPALSRTGIHWSRT